MNNKQRLKKALEYLLGLETDSKYKSLLPEEFLKELTLLISMAKNMPYELKVGMMNFFDRAMDAAEKEHGPDFTPAQLQAIILRMLNGQPANILMLLNDFVKN